jgi:hypothetical protein
MTLALGKMFLGDRFVPQAPSFRLLIDSLQKITKASSTLNFTFKTSELQICLINLLELTHKKANHQLSKDDFCDLYSLLTLKGQPQPILPPNSHIKTQSQQILDACKANLLSQNQTLLQFYLHQFTDTVSIK